MMEWQYALSDASDSQPAKSVTKPDPEPIEFREVERAIRDCQLTPAQFYRKYCPEFNLDRSDMFDLDQLVQIMVQNILAAADPEKCKSMIQWYVDLLRTGSASDGEWIIIVLRMIYVAKHKGDYDLLAEELSRATISQIERAVSEIMFIDPEVISALIAEMHANRMVHHLVTTDFLVIAVIKWLHDTGDYLDKAVEEWLDRELILLAERVTEQRDSECGITLIAIVMEMVAKNNAHDLVRIIDLLGDYPHFVGIWPTCPEPTVRTIHPEQVVQLAIRKESFTILKLIIRQEICTPMQISAIMTYAISNNEWKLLKLMIDQSETNSGVSMVGIFGQIMDQTTAYKCEKANFIRYAQADRSACATFQFRFIAIAAKFYRMHRAYVFVTILNHFTPTDRHQPCTCPGLVHTEPIPIYAEQHRIVVETITHRHASRDLEKKSQFLEVLAQYSRDHDLPVRYYLAGEVFLITHHPLLTPYQRKGYPLQVSIKSVRATRDGTEIVAIAIQKPDTITPAKAQAAISETLSKSARI